MRTRTMNMSNTVASEIDEVVILNKVDIKEDKYKIKDIEETTELSVNKKEGKFITYANAFIKRAIDILGGIVGLIILIPLTIVVAIINFVHKDFGPIFYAQKRIGKNGKYFKMYKFRSMCIDADEKLEKMLAEDEELKKEFEQTRKLKDDPRITKAGHFLRKTSLDEFPQFINVLKGDMSIVGPRAVIDGEIELFGRYIKDILSVKPGITGYWAANGRSDTSYEERVFMEEKYVQSFSVVMDIKIILQTILSVIRKEGAV